jgi:hypothetical protein
MMNTFYFDEQVRALEKQFARDHEAYLREQMLLCTLPQAINFLVREMVSNSSTWSGGNTLKNYEEQVKREIALSLLQELSFRLLAKEERQNEHV